MSERLYQERIVEPAIQAYRNYAHHLGYAQSDIERIVAEKKTKMDAHNLRAVAGILGFVNSKCTYKCRHCNMMLQDIEPFDIGISSFVKWSDNVLSQIDEVARYSFAGGEALLYKEIGKALEYILNQTKIFCVHITTNATIIPDESLIPFMQHPKFYLAISDYGNLRQQAALFEFCYKHSIKYHFHEQQEWIPMEWVSHGRSKDELKKQFSNCTAGKNCHTVYDGRLYHCGQMAAMAAAGMIQPNQFNSLDITGEGDIFEFFAQDYQEACDMCNFGIDGLPLVPAGEQENGKLERSPFIVVPRSELEKRKAWEKELTEGNKWLEQQYLSYKAKYERLNPMRELLRRFKR